MTRFTHAKHIPFTFKKRTNHFSCQKYKLEPTVRTRPVNKRILYEFPISPYKLNGDVKGRTTATLDRQQTFNERWAQETID